MELLQLRYFLVAAQYQHMTKAAEHLQIAQPALSQAIHRLEAELGVPLFERKNRSIELNDEGKFLQKRLIPILSSLDRLPEELRKGKEAATHTVHLSSCTRYQDRKTILTYVLQPGEPILPQRKMTMPRLC